MVENEQSRRGLDHVQWKIVKVYAIVLAAGLAYTAFIFLNGRGMPCMFRELTGYQCPGCGTSRMMLALMRGELGTAFHYNPVAFVALPSWILVSLLAFAGKPAAFRSSRVLLGILYVTIFCYCVQGVLRNLI